MAEYISLGYEIAKVHKALRAKLQEVLNPHGVTVQQFEVLRTVLAEPGLTAAQLVEHIVSDSSTMMSILKRLESKGLIQRQPGKNDGRIKKITLTDKGKALAQRVLGIANRYNKRLNAVCSEQERRVFDRVLENLYAFCRTYEGNTLTDKPE